MSGEAKTLKQIEAAESVVTDAMELLDTYSPRQDSRVETRLVYAAMTITRMRLREVQSELCPLSRRGKAENICSY